MELKGSRLREARLLSGLTLQVMGREVGFSTGYLSRIENNERPIPFRVVQGYERVLAAIAEEVSEVNRRRLLSMIPFVGASAMIDLKGLPSKFESLTSAKKWMEKIDKVGDEYWIKGAAPLQLEMDGLLAVGHRFGNAPAEWEALSRLQMLHAVTCQNRIRAAHIYALAIQSAQNSGYVDRVVAACGRAGIVLAQSG